MPCPFPCNFYSLTHWGGKARVGHRWNWILDIVVACYKPTSLLLHWRGNHIFSLVTHNTINVRSLTWNKKFRKKLQLTSFLSIQQNSYKNAFQNQLTHTFVSWWNILSWPLWSWPQPPGSWDLFPLFNEFVIIFLLLTLIVKMMISDEHMCLCVGGGTLGWCRSQSRPTHPAPIQSRCFGQLSSNQAPDNIPWQE